MTDFAMATLSLVSVAIVLLVGTVVGVYLAEREPGTRKSWHLHEWLTIEGKIIYPRGLDDTINMQVCSKCGNFRSDKALLRETKKGMKK